MKDLLIKVDASKELPKYRGWYNTTSGYRFYDANKKEFHGNDRNPVKFWYREPTDQELDELFRERIRDFAIYYNQNSCIDVITFEFIDEYLKSKK